MDTFFVASLKLTTGEEVLASVCKKTINGNDFIYLKNPITFKEYNTVVDGKMAIQLQPIKFLQFSTDDTVLVPIDKIVAVSELSGNGYEFYNQSVDLAKIFAPIKNTIKTSNTLSYVGNTEKIKDKLEDLFNKHIDEPDQVN